MKGKRSTTTTAQPRGKGIQDIIALRFARKYADTFRFVSVWGQWFEWTGTHWRQERTRKVFNYVRLMLRQSQDGAARPDASASGNEERFADGFRGYFQLADQHSGVSNDFRGRTYVLRRQRFGPGRRVQAPLWIPE